MDVQPPTVRRPPLRDPGVVKNKIQDHLTALKRAFPGLTDDEIIMQALAKIRLDLEAIFNDLR